MRFFFLYEMFRMVRSYKVVVALVTSCLSIAIPKCGVKISKLYVLYVVSSLLTPRLGHRQFWLCLRLSAAL